jgi:hypothetical protein
MMKRRPLAIAALGLLLAAGCPKSPDGGDTSAPKGETPKPDPEPAPTDDKRPELTSAECQAKGGTIVGDIGDGAIHKPDYRCENGQPPLGTIKAEGDEPVAVEGSVCCGAAVP